MQAQHPWFQQQIIISYDDSRSSPAAVEENLVFIRDAWLGNTTAQGAFFKDDAAATGSYPLMFWSEGNVTAHWEKAQHVRRLCVGAPQTPKAVSYHAQPQYVGS